MIKISDNYVDIELPAKSLELSTKFANAQVGSSIDCYQKRGQGSAHRIVSQIISGKLAEIAVAKFYSSLGLVVSMPDFRVYHEGAKSYDADLDINFGNRFYPLHVKSISSESASKFGLSWIFQRSDPLYFAPARIDLKDDRIALCETLSDSCVRFYGLCDPNLMKSNSKPLKVKALQHTKVALYHKEISEHLNLLPQIDAITTFSP